MHYLITYDLNKVGQDYSGLIAQIKTYAHIKPMKSAWFIKTTEPTAEGVYNKLSKFIDRNDLLLVMEVHRNNYGWLPQPCWDFLKQ